MAINRSAKTLLARPFCGHTQVLVSAVPLLLFGCTDSNELKIRDACVAANADTQNSAHTTSSCSCFASTARKYLDQENYELLAKVSEVYISDRSEGQKVGELTTALIDSGVSPAQAGITAMDFMLLVHKVNRECGT